MWIFSYQCSTYYCNLRKTIFPYERQSAKTVPSSFLRKKTLYFDIFSFDPIKYELHVSPVLEDENRKYYLSLLYQEIDDAFLLTLIQEDHSIEESSERTLIKNQVFSRIKEE